MPREEFVDQEILDRIRVGKDYVRAKYGFRNHWYPAMVASDLNEQEPRPVTLLGENILLNRIDGQVFGIRDRCLHRGVPLSRKVECYTKGTISCWYHGFTYRFNDGVLCDIAGTEGSAVIGRRKLRTYPVTEAKGIIFVFVGDDDFTPPPLIEDVPPTFLDDDMVIHSLPRMVKSNWRIGCENGFDSTHIFIHKDSVLLEEADLCLPLGLQPQGRQAFERQEEQGGPKGVFEHYGAGHVAPIFTGTIEGEEVLQGRPQGKNILPSTISMWLPCVLRVDPWPSPETTQFEWYVPVDAQHHIYFQTLGKRCQNEEEQTAWASEFNDRWVPNALEGFNADDVWAREATEPFYADDQGWVQEMLFEPDANIVEWRKLASTHARGIQKPEHIDPPGHAVLSVVPQASHNDEEVKQS